jgi:hypothetical protein
METNVTYINSKKPLTRDDMAKLLRILREREQSTPNPLLKDWFVIRNQIRQLEKEINKTRRSL